MSMVIFRIRHLFGVKFKMKRQKLRSMIQIFLENYMQDFMKACVTFYSQEVNLSNKRHFIIIKFVYVTFF